MFEGFLYTPAILAGVSADDSSVFIRDTNFHKVMCVFRGVFGRNIWVATSYYASLWLRGVFNEKIAETTQTVEPLIDHDVEGEPGISSRTVRKFYIHVLLFLNSLRLGEL